MSIYEALGVSAEGKRVAVKISTGESSRTNYLRPEFIKNLVQKLGANIVGAILPTEAVAALRQRIAG